MRTFSYLCGACLIGLFGAAHTVRADDKVIVHEWGTFTCLQDGDGQAIGGINVDDEPVPWFVCQIPGTSVASQYTSSEDSDPGTFGLPPYGSPLVKGWIAGDPAVTMRLETPVLYLYPPQGRAPQSVPPLDVHVDFHGGILSQFYPMATVSGLPVNGTMPYFQGTITGETTTGLTWKGVQLGATGKLIETEDKTLKDVPWMRGQPVETDDKVWTTPREVAAPLLQVKISATDNLGKHEATEAEHFLFYRGVGHLDSPLYLNRDPYNVGKKDSLYVWPSWLDTDSHAPTPQGDIALDAMYAEGWLAEIHADGSCAFRTVSSFQEGSRTRVHPLTNLSSKFESIDFRTDNLTKLKASMHDALVKEGLYDDEATAMLKTWELSYFKSPGLRFFYIVPRTWVDQVLPLKITGAPTEITRVMVGRIELIADAQKAALARLAVGPCPDLGAVKKTAEDAIKKGKLSDQEKQAFYAGEKPLSDLGITIPPLVQDYLSLGRFRDALVVHEQQQHPSAALAQFIKDNALASQETGYRTIVVADPAVKGS